MTIRFVKSHFLWILLFLISIPLNPYVIYFFQYIRTDIGIYFFTYLSSFIFFIALVGVSVETIIWHNKKELILPFFLSFFVSLWIGITIKNLFGIDRPFITYQLPVLVPEYGYSFPSLHTIQTFSLLPLIWYKNKKIGQLWLVFSLLIALSRMYLNVHYFSDVVFGGLLGYSVSQFFLLFEQKHKTFSVLYQLLKNQLEIRRQLFHTIFGCILIFCIKISLITSDSILILIILSLLFIILLKKYKIPKSLYTTLSLFEREKHLKQFPARGVFTFLIGSYLSLLLFPEHIALASIIILSFGDSVTNIIGRYFGKKKIWYNSKKHWEGSLAGAFFATIGASFFVPLWMAGIASIIGMFVETFSFKFGHIELDDNIIIPLVSGYVLQLITTIYS